MTNMELPNIGNKIREVRQNRGLTLDDASRLTSVSKAMLGQIERNESIPTISILWKVAGGLRISMSDLLKSDNDDLEPIKIEDDLEPVFESNNKMVLYNIFPFSPASGFEYFYIKMYPGAEHTSSAHNNVIEEYVVVTKGKMDVSVDGVRYTLEAPASFQFQPKEEHTYSNPYDEEAVFQNIVKY